MRANPHNVDEFLRTRTLSHAVSHSHNDGTREDAWMSSELFEASLESFRKLAASRQKIVLAAFRDERAAKLVAETVGIEPASPVIETASVAPTIASTKPTKFCRFCGVRIVRDSMFCEECGAELT